jgi:hypothetical protein
MNLNKLLWLIPYSSVAAFLILFGTTLGDARVVGAMVISVGGAIRLFVWFFGSSQQKNSTL